LFGFTRNESQLFQNIAARKEDGAEQNCGQTAYRSTKIS
jgi:hypothetical protein